jgi:hypothetical protein
MANTYLSKTFSSAGSLTTWTWSGWVKRANLTGSNQFLFSGGVSDQSGLHFDANEQLIHRYNTSFVSLQTSQVFRDTNAWYHIVAVYDSTNATSSDRMILYVNGSRVTDFVAETYPSQNTDGRANTATSHVIGNESYTGYRFPFDGSMSHVHFIDGTAYDASAFGEYDANGVWKAKTSPSVTYGTNGFFILKDSASVTDQSGNGNNFTVGGGTLTDTLDCPANVFCTMNPLDNYWQNSTFTNGNNTFVTVASNENYNTSTLAMPSNDAGKYYCEVKVDSASAYTVLGIAGKLTTSATSNFKNHSDGYALTSDSGNIINNNISSSYGVSYTTNDIIGIAVDTDNNKLYFSKNGTWMNSGVPTSGATGTGAISITTDTTNGYYMFAGGTRHNDSAQLSWNFGNGYFGTTAVASAGTNASGIGIFEYDVPTGYTALCTKGLNGE